MQEKIVIIYDGINHSIFESQVLNPLVQELSTQNDISITLISFESEIISLEKLHFLNTINPKFKVFIFKKTPYFLGFFSIIFAKIQCENIISSLSSYTIQARGPIAGAIVQSIISPLCNQFTLQARGLLAEEFLYSQHESLLNKSWYKKIFIYLRYKQLFYFEKKIYEWKNPYNFSFIIESVSKALESHLQKTYSLTTKKYTLATQDIPSRIPFAQKNIWRQQIRSQLKLDQNQHIYIYNGSCKPWQCFKETIIYFKEHLEKKSSYLIIVTPDIKEALKIINHESLSKDVFYITSVPHSEIYSYLCASDSGIILRKEHIVNWVSRPTKVLEYKAAHLSIIHNNTIAYLQSENGNNLPL